MSIGKIIDGKAFAAGLRERVAEGVAAFVDQAGRKPGLAVVLVGEDPASSVYVRSKGKMYSHPPRFLPLLLFHNATGSPTNKWLLDRNRVRSTVPSSNLGFDSRLRKYY